MDNLGAPNPSSNALADPAGRGVADVSGNVIGRLRSPVRGQRLLWALSLTASGVQRYLPNHPPGEQCEFGYDFSALVAPGFGLVGGTLAILTNLAVPADASADWTIGPVTFQRRQAYCLLAGGVLGADYRLQWSVTDTLGNAWVRTGLILCAATG